MRDIRNPLIAFELLAGSDEPPGIGGCKGRGASKAEGGYGVRDLRDLLIAFKRK